MKDFPVLGGAGGVLGGGSRAPQNKPDNLFSDDFVEFVLGLCEGPIGGLARGPRSFYADGTPLVSADGQNNFDPFQLHLYHGDLLATPVRQALGGTTSNTNVGVSLAYNTPVIRTTDQSLRNLIDQLEVRINIQSLSATSSKGDTVNHTTEFQIEYREVGEVDWIPFYGDGPVSLTGKTSSGYVREFVVDVPRTSNDWEIRVTKLTQDNLPNVVDALVWESFQAVTKEPKAYPNLALARGYARASNQFQSIPNWTAVYHAKIIKVPSNYDVVTRYYDGVWDGTFIEAVSDNPAWVLYDILTNSSYGFRRYYPDLQVDRFSFYEAAKWCDELVPRPGGGYQPRWTYNEVIDNRRSALELVYYLAGIFGGVPLSNYNGQIRLKVDKPGAPVQIFGPESVSAEGFSYQFTDIGQRINDVTVNFINPNLGWEPDVRRVTADQSILDANGYIPSTIDAVGCIDVYEAQRRAYKRIIQANTEKVTVTFSTARAGLQLEIFDLIGITDPDMNWGISGRVKSVVGSLITLRDQIFVPAETDLQFEVVTPTGPETLTVRSTTAATTELIIISGTYPASAPDQAQFAITHESLGLVKPFRILSIEEDPNSSEMIKVSALEQNINKYGDIDNLTSSGTIDYASDLADRPPAPTNVVVESGDAHILTTADGNRINRMRVSWDVDTSYFISKSKVTVHDLDADRARTFDATGTDFYLQDVVPGNSVRVTVSTLSATGRPSPSSTPVVHVVEGRTNRPDPATSWVGVPGISTITLKGPKPTIVDFSHHLVEMYDAQDALVGTDTFDGTVFTRSIPDGDTVTYYVVKVVDRSGNMGDPSPNIAVLPRPVSTSDLGTDVTDIIDDIQITADTAEDIALEAQDIILSISRNPYFEHDLNGWFNDTAGTVPSEDIVGLAMVSGGPTANKAVEATGHRNIHGSLFAVETDRTYRVRFRVKATGAGPSSVWAGVATYDENGTLETTAPGTHRYAAVRNGFVPVDGEWHVYEGLITGTAASDNSFRPTTKFVRPVALLNYVQDGSYICEVDELSIQDVTESKEAEAFADEAENHANTALTEATVATTQAGYATDAAAAAANSALTSARAFSSAFKNPVFSDWDGPYPLGVSVNTSGGSSVTKATDGEFGNAIVLDTGSALTGNYPTVSIASSHNQFELPLGGDTIGVRVKFALELVSGAWSGTMVRVTWSGGTGGTTKYVDHYIQDHLGQVSGVQTLELVVPKPEGYVKGSSGDYVQVMFFGTTSTGGYSRAQNVTRIHRWEVDALTNTAASYIAQIAKVTLDQHATSSLVMRAISGDANAGIELVSFSAPGGSVAQGKLYADQWLIDGDVRASKLSIDGSLDLSVEGAAFRMGKMNPINVDTTGVYYGVYAGNFSFMVGTKEGTVERYLQMLPGSFKAVNLELFVDGSTADAEVEITTTQTIDLPLDRDLVEGSITGAGGGGASAYVYHNYGDGESYSVASVNGSAGGVSKIEILDGTTVVHTVTASGGSGGSGTEYGYHPGDTSAASPYGDGGHGGSPYGSNSGSSRYGHGGEAGATLVLEPFDYSGLTDPKIRFTIGAGGAGGPQVPNAPDSTSFPNSGGGSGVDGVGFYRTRESTQIPVGAVAPSLTTSGTVSVTSGVAASLPDLGRGLWVISNVPNGMVLSEGAVVISENYVAGGTVVLLSDGQVSYDTSHTESRNMEFKFWVMS